MTVAGDTLSAVALTKRFGAVTAARNVDLTVRRGETVGLFGRSGSGKSTIFQMLAGTIAGDGGSVFLDGIDVTSLDLDKRSRLGIGYLPQSPQLFTGLTVEANLLITTEHREPDRARRRRTIERLLEAYGLAPWRRRKVAALSGGERRQCELAFVMATQPRFLLLDEPLTGLDPLVSAVMKKRIGRLAAAGIGVLVTDHKVREALSMVDRAHVIDQGEIIASGVPRELVADDRVRAAYLGYDFRVS